VRSIILSFASVWIRNKGLPSSALGCVLVCFTALGIGQAVPSFESFYIARGANPRVFAIVDRESAIGQLSDDGEILSNVGGAHNLMKLTSTTRAARYSGPPLF
jgi:hypothetical protein